MTYSKYKKINNTFVKSLSDDVRDTFEIEVGDIKQKDFKPQVKFKRWDNEVNFSIRAAEHRKCEVKKDGDKIRYITPDYELHQYEKENGFEFEWVIDKKPKSNIFKSTIQSKGLDFYYQGELSAEENEEGKFRPENIVGSYAVYTKERKLNFEGGKKYRSGKFGHIYRPKAIDDKGSEQWCDLNINDGLLTVTVPEEFLDTAVYPVIIDPIIGYNIEGGTLATVNNTYHPFCSLYNTYSAVTGDKIIKFTAFLGKITNNVNVQVAAYSISGSPVSRLTSPVDIAVTSVSPQWFDSSAVSQTMTNGVEYNVAYGNWQSSPNNVNIYFDDTSGSQSSYHNATGALPATWSQQTTFISIISAYATYIHPPITIKYAYNIFIDKGKL